MCCSMRSCGRTSVTLAWRGWWGRARAAWRDSTGCTQVGAFMLGFVQGGCVHGAPDAKRDAACARSVQLVPIRSADLLRMSRLLTSCAVHPLPSSPFCSPRAAAGRALLLPCRHVRRAAAAAAVVLDGCVDGNGGSRALGAAACSSPTGLMEGRLNLLLAGIRLACCSSS